MENCPNCGWSVYEDPEYENCEVLNERTDTAGQMDHGGLALEWTERWTCPVCGTVFELENSSD